MSRKIERVIVPTIDGQQNRDAGKMFQITEWDSATAERWGIKMILALNRSAGEIPMDLRGIGMEGVAVLGINTFLRGAISASEIIPLLDELFDCVRLIRDQRHPDVVTEIASPDDIEDVSTRLWLRSEVLRVHTGFSPAAALQALAAAIFEKKSPDSSNTPTSLPESG